MLDSGSPRRTMVLRHPQTRVYQPDRASRTACRTATHPADHNPHEIPNANARNLVPHLTTRSPYQHPTSPRVAGSITSVTTKPTTRFEPRTARTTTGYGRSSAASLDPANVFHLNHNIAP